MTDTEIRRLLVEKGHDWMIFARALLKEEREKIARLVELRGELDALAADIRGRT